ncbi:hypothetical protein ACFQX6_20365 [Streptosporangium lutulentum]
MSPFSTGFGSVPGQPSSITLPPRDMRASGAPPLPLPPPPEKARPTAVAAGATVPSGRSRSVVSTGTQPSA